MKFTATSRKEQGTSASRRLRREDKVPGIVYGNDKPVELISIDHNELFYDLRKESFHSSILTMTLDGKDELVVLRAFQLHPFKSRVLHADFQRIDANAPVTMRVPLHFFGDELSPAVKIDKGFISHLVSMVEVSCLPKDLPESVKVDLSKMTSQDTLRVADLQLPEGVTAVEPNTPIATVTVIAEEAAAPVAAAAAAPAAGAAAPAAGAAAAAPAADAKKEEEKKPEEKK